MDRALRSHGKGMLAVMCITPASTATTKSETVKTATTIVTNLCFDMEPLGSHQSYALAGRTGFG